MAKYDPKLQEEELKLHVAEDWFPAYDCKRKIGKIDFCVEIPATELGLFDAVSALWAESKAGTHKDIHESFVQLILTIGRAKINGSEQPPFFLGAFDAEKIAFLPYDAVMDVFTQNDFNWNVTPSDHTTKEFAQLHALAEKTIAEQSLLFDYEKDEAELKKFIRTNFVTGRKDVSRIQITRNNFTHIYQKWRTAVLPSLDVGNWDALRKDGIIDADFFLADILSDKDNRTIRKKLYVLLQSDVYEVKYGKAASGLDLVTRIGFSDGQSAHRTFWNRYTRPPRKDYWDFIVARRDLLVDQDVRERKGAFFTPRKWVELSQEYLARELGDNWQDDHYVWDCCGGTGNLEAGLTNKYNVWVSTLDKADVDVMHTRIKMMNEQVPDGANLLDTHVFQFDFLNDSFDKLPPGLKDIIDDPAKRQKLVIYINPPYAEAATSRTITGTGKNKVGVATNAFNQKYKPVIGAAANELFALFLMRIHDEIPGCVVGQFSKLKHVIAPNFRDFRASYNGILAKSFLVPSSTFDNVKGKFPIGFFVWRLFETPSQQTEFAETTADIYDRNGELVGKKTLCAVSRDRVINTWLHGFFDPAGEIIGWLCFVPNDFQHNNGVFICLKPSQSLIRESRVAAITVRNFSVIAMYLAIRQCIEATWLNDRDQFLFPNDAWRNDADFIGDCLAYTLFHGQNRIMSADGPNHWIPFTEAEVGAADCFASHFMSDFIAGRVGGDPRAPRNPDSTQLSLGVDCGLPRASAPTTPHQGTQHEAQGTQHEALRFSAAAKCVLDAGRELWRYYHAQPGANPNASYYDIRKHFQGTKTSAAGKEQMNATSDDAQYNALLNALKSAMKNLAAQIAPKVYAYGFLKA